DDGKSLCFDLPVAAPLDIIGEPVLRLTLALDAPQGNLIARLCDVHPDGTSHRISLGVLNLSHRAGSSEPRTMVPGQPEEITLTLDATAYRLRPGHRLRLALSTQYFPLVIPPPTEVTATLNLGQAVLELPQYDFTETQVPEPEADTLPQFETVAEGTDHRETVNDGTQTRIRSGTTGPRLRHAGHGMEWQVGRSVDYTVSAAGFEGRETYTNTLWRYGIATHTRAEGHLIATDRDWHLTTRLSCEEDHQPIFEHVWTRTIPRDHV
ncbi:MAG: CocE/NonD family hydrolase C-terminal non-catalytic domain-containing protein, partial [Pseudomonadota bacterium]